MQRLVIRIVDCETGVIRIVKRSGGLRVHEQVTVQSMAVVYKMMVMMGLMLWLMVK